MAIKKPSSSFGFQDALWLAFALGFLVMVFTSTGCKSTEVVKDRDFFHEHGDRFNRE